MTRSWRGLAEVLGEPRTRLGLGIGGLLGTAVAVRRDRVGPREARVFLAVNGLADALYPAAWVVMQAGAFGDPGRRSCCPGPGTPRAREDLDGD
jgi:hypothetical protein